MRWTEFALCMTSLIWPLMAQSQQGMPKPVLSAAPQLPPAEVSAKSATTAAGGLPVVLPSYVIGPEDGIQVTVWHEPTLSGPLSVRPDGMISLPLLGDVTASGLTPVQLSSDLATRLKKFINDPLVTVTLVAVNSKHVFLLGEVLRVGPLALTPEMTVLQAISSSGGLSPYANAKHIYILRGQPGSQKKLFFDYKKAVKTGNEQGIVLQPGDTIVVP